MSPDFLAVVKHQIQILDLIELVSFRPTNLNVFIYINQCRILTFPVCNFLLPCFYKLTLRAIENV